MEINQFLVLISGMLVISAGSALLIYSLSQIFYKLKVKQSLIFIFLIGFGAILPELLLAIAAISYQTPSLILGQSIGLAIISLTLLVGLLAFLSNKLSVRNLVQKGEITFIAVAISMVLVLLSDGSLSSFDGLMLIILAIYYIYSLTINNENITLSVPVSKKPIALHVLGIPLLSIAIGIASTAIVGSAQVLAQSGTNLLLTGLLIIAPFAIIPEFIVEIFNLRNKNQTLALGDLLTSVVMNMTLVLGITAIFAPISAPKDTLLNFSEFILAVTILMVSIFMRTKYQLSKKEGIALIIFFFIYYFLSLQVISQGL